MFADYVYFSDNLKRYYPNIYSNSSSKIRQA